MRAGKIILIILASILTCVIAVIGLFAYFLFHVETKVSYDLERWDELEQLDTYDLPSSSEIGDFEKIACKYYYQRQYIFVSEAYTLKAAYLEDEFEKQKKLIDEKYTFLSTVTIRDDNGETSTEKPATFVHDGFKFRMIEAVWKGYRMYPKVMIFIGTSDTTNEIAYVLFMDSDLDYVPGSLEEFFIEQCGWYSKK